MTPNWCANRNLIYLCSVGFGDAMRRRAELKPYPKRIKWNFVINLKYFILFAAVFFSFRFFFGVAGNVKLFVYPMFLLLYSQCLSWLGRKDKFEKLFRFALLIQFWARAERKVLARRSEVMEKRKKFHLTSTFSRRKFSAPLELMLNIPSPFALLKPEGKLSQLASIYRRRENLLLRCVTYFLFNFRAIHRMCLIGS